MEDNELNKMFVVSTLIHQCRNQGKFIESVCLLLLKNVDTLFYKAANLFVVVWPQTRAYIYWCLTERCNMLFSRYALLCRWIWCLWILAQKRGNLSSSFGEAYQLALWILMIASCSLSPEVLSRKSWERGENLQSLKNWAFEEKALQNRVCFLFYSWW